MSDMYRAFLRRFQAETLGQGMSVKRDDCEGCDLAFLDNDEGWMCQYAAKDDDAADAIEELQQIADHHEQTAKDYWKEACEYKAQLPKRGEWIKHEDDACECSVCGLGLESFVEGIFYNFCPFCGADMRAKMEVQE